MTDERPRTRREAPEAAPSRRAASGREQSMLTPRPIPPLPTPVAGMGGVRRTNAQEDAPMSGTVSPSGTGQDVRHRGWYWHWNTLVTQYAPLLGLKGVGLLNSYTVWTDRREGSPHQGFAFPAQESEARFYGEGREELITLNKILVALDLVEIHKEMVIRQDDKGRRWRVPHNFYKVKDPKDGLVLGLPAVVRLLELAARDRNVFRQIRHIFGPQFAPIDRTSLWHSLLPELRALPLWQELEARAARERRTPRKVTTSAQSAATEAEIPPETTENTGSIDITDDGLPSIVTSEDDASTIPTVGAPTIRCPADIATFIRGDVGISHTGSRMRSYAVQGNDDALPPTKVRTANVDPLDADKPPMADEGMTDIEGASHGSVNLADDMYYGRGKTREETTNTTRTTPAHTRTHAREDEDTDRTRSPDPRHSRSSQTYDNRVPRSTPPRERPANPLPIPEDLPPPPPARPSVSDLFMALDEQRRMAPPPIPAPDPSPPEDSPPQSPDTPGGTQTRGPNTPTHAQPLPPEPGQGPDGQEGPIVVRAVAVTDQPAIGREEHALLVEIESALARANNRPPSDMEMSLYWQIAQDCDRAARDQEGPGTGLGWVLAAITEAAFSSGLGRIAPKYIARICERWMTDGYMRDGRTAPTADTPPSPPQWPLQAAPQAPESLPERAVSEPPPAPMPLAPPTEAEISRLWGGVLRRLDSILPAQNLQLPWFTKSRVHAVEGEQVIVVSPDEESARKLAHYRGLISRRLSDLLGYPVEAVFQSEPEPPEPAPTAPPTGDAPPREADTAPDSASPPLQSSTRVHTLSETDARSTPSSASAPWSWPATGGATTLPAEVSPRPSMGSGPMPVVSDAGRHGAQAEPSSPRVVSRDRPLERSTPAPPLQPQTLPTFAVGDEGETNKDIWPRALALVREGMTDAAFKVWMEPTALIARDSDGTFVVGARNKVQRERLERQHLDEITRALGAVLGRDVRVRIAMLDEHHAQ